MRAEILITEDTRGRGVQILNGMLQTAKDHGIEARATRHYEGKDDLLLMWGPGAPLRYRNFKEHAKRGGRPIAFDMGYWRSGRGYDVMGMNRITIDQLHPKHLVMQHDFGPERFAEFPVRVDDLYDPNGHIVLVGLGMKTCDQFGLRLGEWEQKTLERIQLEIPRRRIVYRPKPQCPYYGLPVATDNQSHIETVLAGAALVVCRHSNVAMDALRLGIPAVCDDGAAAAICSSEMKLHAPPPYAVRMQFLQNLAHWQWSIAEAWNGAVWGFLTSMLRVTATPAVSRSPTSLSMAS